MPRTGYIGGSNEMLADLEEAFGRLYALDTGRVYPMPPDVIGPGKQPEPIERTHQRYYRRIQAARGEEPRRIETDEFIDSCHDRVVILGTGRPVRLDLGGAVRDPPRGSGRG